MKSIADKLNDLIPKEEVDVEAIDIPTKKLDIRQYEFRKYMKEDIKHREFRKYVKEVHDGMAEKEGKKKEQTGKLIKAINNIYPDIFSEVDVYKKDKSKKSNDYGDIFKNTLMLG